MRFVFAIVAASVLLLGVAAPHHHGGSGGVHECVACTVGGALEARDTTPTLCPPPPVRVVFATGSALVLSGKREAVVHAAAGNPLLDGAVEESPSGTRRQLLDANGSLYFSQKLTCLTRR